MLNDDDDDDDGLNDESNRFSIFATGYGTRSLVQVVDLLLVKSLLHLNSLVKPCDRTG